MFRDEEDDIQEEVALALHLYSLEDILEHNAITIEEALTKLIMDGHLILPEITPVKY